MGCGKVIHDTRENAESYGNGHHVYYCDRCSAWHTSYRQFKARKVRGKNFKKFSLKTFYDSKRRKK